MASALRLYDTVDELAVAREFLDEHADAIAANGGELPPELEALLDHAYASFEQKVERVALFAREQLTTAAGVREEVKRLTGRATAFERAGEAIKRYLLRQMQRAEVASVKRPLATVRVQANPPALRHGYDTAALLAIADEQEAFDALRGDDGPLGGALVERLLEDGAAPPSPLARFVTVVRVATLDAKAVLAAWREREAVLQQEAAAIILTPEEIERADLDTDVAIASYPHGPLPVDEEERAYPECRAERLAEKRARHVADALAREFPGVTVERGAHLRIA